MKKVMFAGIAALCGAVMADGGIESQNIVGYTTQNFMQKSTFYMMGTQFETANGGSLKLSDLNFGDLSNAPYYNEFIDENGFIVSAAPEVRVANANSEGFTTYYYILDGKPTETEGVYEPGWIDVNFEYQDPTLITGIGFWFNNPCANTPVLTTSGGVPDDPFIQKEFDNTFRVLVNPYPKATVLSDIVFTGINDIAPMYNEFIDENGFIVTPAPEIRVPNANTEGFQTYYYLKDGKPTATEGVYEPGWVDVNFEYQNPTIPIGRGCWFKSTKTTAGNMTVTFYP